MTRFTIAILPGDGIGPEVTREAVRCLDAVSGLFGWSVTRAEFPIGAAAMARHGSPFPSLTRDAVGQADAALLGAVGDAAFDRAPPERRPEAGLLALRRHLGVFANLRPVKPFAELAASSPLRAERIAGVDLLILRELTGGIYYGTPRSREPEAALNTLRYSAGEIERVARMAFEIARRRRRRVASVDKANVLEVSQLWRDVVTRVGRDYSDVTLDHLYVDSAAMRLIAEPGWFDVLLTENLFGDILSDEAAVLAGSLGLLPSGSLGRGPGLFEPVHGSAPDLAGRGVANPAGAIGSAAMLLRYGLGQEEAADLLEAALARVIARGARTRDVAEPGVPVLSTGEFGARVVEAIRVPQPASR
ncbi:MAG: 3-isopropylmalate dehydrogenase [Gemmatimonadales bacterium]